MMKVFGEHTVDSNGQVVCKCGKKDMFEMVAHIDMKDVARTDYKCTNCGNIISTEEEREISWE